MGVQPPYGVNLIAVAIDGSVEILPYAFDFDIRFVGLSRSAGLPFVLRSRSIAAATTAMRV
ncbi:MAG: hypothetical protein NVSMB42_13920 [Herpetosiphon sp.]